MILGIDDGVSTCLETWGWALAWAWACALGRLHGHRHGRGHMLGDVGLGVGLGVGMCSGAYTTRRCVHWLRIRSMPGEAEARDSTEEGRSGYLLNLH